MSSRFPPVSELLGVRGRDQWLHCAFGAEAPSSLAVEDDLVLLAPLPPDVSAPAAGPAPRRHGLAIDRNGRLYRAEPENGVIVSRALAQPEALTLAPPLPPEPLPDAANGPAAPSALAISSDDHLFVIGETEAAVFVYDLLARRYRGAHALPRRPVDLAVAGGRVHVLLDAPSAWLAFSLCDRPQALDWPAGLTGATRLAFSSCGKAFVLVDGGTGSARVVNIGRPRRGVAPEGSTPTPGGREIALLARPGGTALVVAAGPGEPIRRFLVTESGVGEDASYDGRLYDGCGILATPDGRVVYEGLREGRDLGPLRAAPARRLYAREGEVILFRLDAGAPANRWGRLFLDACLPEGAAVIVRTRTSDEPDEGAPIERTPPANLAEPPTLAGDSIAVLPSKEALDQADAWGQASLLRAGDGDGPFAAYEAPILAPPGRYLWLRLTLTGRGSTTPRIRRVMAERKGHDWLKHLPRAFARRDVETEEFMHALLTPVAALLADADRASATRHRLFDPLHAPADALPWLGDMLGFPVEPEWPESVTRRMLAEATQLLRARGTPATLVRMLEILTGHTVTIIESFRIRAGGGVGGEAAHASTAVVGAGFRVGGGLTDGETAVGPAAESGIASHAHRFTVLVHGRLPADVEQAARRLLERHRPAHTLYTLCSVDAGLRVGAGGLVGISTLVGPSSGFMPAVLGSALVGKGTLVARGGLSTNVFGDAP
ncbi:MAG: phage tail protein [Methylocystis sp.]|uniref:phage tail protein n=1 Tax=Methylocystis sp. TaxID=1911079 RepID=UPI003DA5174C